LIFFFQAEDGIRDRNVTGVQTCALPIYSEQVEQRLVNEYQTKRAKNFTRVRSIYNEKNVLNHVFKDVKPVSDEFTVLAKKALVRSEERRVGKERRGRRRRER